MFGNTNYKSVFGTIIFLNLLIIVLLCSVMMYLNNTKKTYIQEEIDCVDPVVFYDEHNKKIKMIIFVLIGITVLAVSNLIAVYLCKTEKI